jgi:hypothetical protein
MIVSRNEEEPVKYMLLIYGDPTGDMPPNAPDGAYESWEVATESLRSDGVLLGGDGLAPTESATTVRNRGGERLLTDGPFAETKEQLGGYYVVDVPGLDDALEAAARIPGARFGQVEVRPILEVSG